ncbi:RNA polymerase sigma-70 factor, ECF subfamily [Jiangella alkaliphila]|uniref:RNA polymerase sigma-70 factor, ECF subfamily n=1 Tax=Jiangella alkaliphila TaxID=419479 RepID=A0A1H2L6Z6_9ACTN|nr:RNA polymerase sigma-70 factor, ECF subfamily [Jiangella alkaliphila]
MRRAADGDAEAFAALFERFYEPLYRYFAARIPDRVEAEDMAAAVFVEVARGLPGFHSGGAAFIGWLFTVARHDLADAHRHHRRHRVDPVAEVPEPEAAPDVAEQVIGRLEAHRLRAALNRLTGDQRDVVLLKFAAGLSNEEVARALGKPVSAVKSLQHRALAALHRLLEEP